MHHSLNETSRVLKLDSTDSYLEVILGDQFIDLILKDCTVVARVEYVTETDCTSVWLLSQKFCAQTKSIKRVLISIQV